MSKLSIAERRSTLSGTQEEELARPLRGCNLCFEGQLVGRFGVRDRPPPLVCFLVFVRFLVALSPLPFDFVREIPVLLALPSFDFVGGLRALVDLPFFELCLVLEFEAFNLLRPARDCRAVVD